MIRRWRGSEPPWGQAAANTNQPYFIRPSGQRKWQRWPIRWQRRGEYWSGPYFQAAENTNGYLIRHSPQRKWLRIPSRWFGRGRAPAPAWFQAAANTNQPVFVPPSGQRKWLRLPSRLWGRGRAPAPPWFQANATPNPVFVEWWRRHGLRALLAVRRGRVVQPPMDQLVPMQSSRPRRGPLGFLRRSRATVPGRIEEQPRKYSAPRRSTALRTRARVVQPPFPPPVQPQAPAFIGWFRRSRRTGTFRRRGSYVVVPTVAAAVLGTGLRYVVDSLEGIWSAFSGEPLASSSITAFPSQPSSAEPGSGADSLEPSTGSSTEVPGQ